MKKTLIEITTADTKKTYTIEPYVQNNFPQLWAVSLSIGYVDNGYERDMCIEKTIYLERETLENAGLLPKIVTNDEKTETPETTEDLIIRLLNHVGFYPTI